MAVWDAMPDYIPKWVRDRLRHLEEKGLVTAALEYAEEHLVEYPGSTLRAKARDYRERLAADAPPPGWLHGTIVLRNGKEIRDVAYRVDGKLVRCRTKFGTISVALSQVKGIKPSGERK